ncbi:hypothetical protein E2R51_02325 [Jeotgalibacillus sp. S-D1]|uniref:hypothetical protein n=1 Tax=Jeotgalibacillus sp. S-D1 TaxID=2552189 RepID=UPI00105A44A7|nr:hypothetical protein [Jeotgalibacillus sp. S-D1]TDL34573.1 hypothetical protein E2R51_02325 [Jeotgalibacillus sp. S-D1]
MAKYKVAQDFTDLTDDHVYFSGDKFPRKGRAKKERIEELSTTNNKIGKVLIVEQKEEGDA